MCKMTNSAAFRGIRVDLFYYFGEGFTKKQHDTGINRGQNRHIVHFFASIYKFTKSFKNFLSISNMARKYLLM